METPWITTNSKHGTHTRYRFGCRCLLCKKAHREECRRESSLKRRIVKLEYIWSKKDAPCVDCGNKFHPFCMDYDHVRGVKRQKGVGTLTLCSLATIDEEIAKCDLVCANCHRLRTHKRGYKRLGKQVTFNDYFG